MKWNMNSNNSMAKIEVEELAPVSYIFENQGMNPNMTRLEYEFHSLVQLFVKKGGIL